jgi:hypothetical protein
LAQGLSDSFKYLGRNLQGITDNLGRFAQWRRQTEKKALMPGKSNAFTQFQLDITRCYINNGSPS